MTGMADTTGRTEQKNATATATSIRLDRGTTDADPTAVRDDLAGRSPEDLRVVAVTVATEAARHVRQARAEAVGGVGRLDVEDTKLSEVDPVTAIDRSSEGLIRRRLRELTDRGAGPDAVLGEEDGGVLADTGVTWIVDPVDGTVNLVYGIPASAVSIAACVDGVPVAGAVADISHDTVYSACSGGDPVVTTGGVEQVGAGTVPGTVARSVDRLSAALVGTGFSYVASRRRAQASLLMDLLPEVRDIRRMGSAALDLCSVAVGQLDAYYEHGLGAWDHAAGSLIAARSGAVVFMPPLHCGHHDGVGILAAAPGIAGDLAGRVLGVTFASSEVHP
jgi:myo-inositol-1(or 4)-monophosphatase